MKAAVIGSPVSHSLSPAIFRFIAIKTDSPLDYSAHDVNLNTLSDFIRSVRNDSGYTAINVTIPLKESIIKTLDQISEEAQMIGAVNVVQKKGDKLIGHNTDAIGIQKTFSLLDFSPAGKICLIFGAGGSAKALSHVLGKGKANKVYLFNPRSDRGKQLARFFNQAFPDADYRAISALHEIKDETLSLIVNCTPVESNPADFFKPIEQLKFSELAMAFDLIYKPSTTEFQKISKSLGLIAVGGLNMLIEQAIATWEICIHKLQDREKLHLELEKFLKGLLFLQTNKTPVFLTGFMGAGKTTLGNELSQLTGRTFMDTDQCIEKEIGLTVAQLFDQKGESEFRKTEKKVIDRMIGTTGSVVSLGGGTLLDKENLNKIRKSGLLVLLNCGEETLLKRLSNTARPLFAGLDTMETRDKLKMLMKERSVNYACSNLEVSTDNLRPIETAINLISKIGELHAE